MFHVEDRDGVALFRLDDGKLNVMGPDFVQRFPAAWREVGARPVVVAGNGRALSAGLDLKRLPALAPKELADFAHGFHRVFRDVLAHPAPVVCAVDGASLAGGAVLALVSDWRIATPGARIGLTEVPVGVPFPPAVSALARARLPIPEHAPALLRGLVREGEAALDHGWVHEVVPRERLLEAALAAAREMGSFSPVAYSSAKTALTADLLLAFDAFDAEAWVRDLHRPESLAALQRTMERLARR